MRTKLWTCGVLLAVVGFMADEVYAWCRDPEASWTVSPSTFSGGYYYVCKGEVLTFDANDSNDPDCSSCSGDDYCEDGIGL